MADTDTNTPKVFTEIEHAAILAATVLRETASLSDKLTAVESEKSSLATQLDVAEAAKVSLESEKAAAVTALEDFKASIEAEKASLAKKDDRLKVAKETAAHLPEEFWADAARIDRIVAFSDDEFTGYVADLAATAGDKAPVLVDGVPRTSAMLGTPVTPPASEGTPSVAAKYLFPTLSI